MGTKPITVRESMDGGKKKLKLVCSTCSAPWTDGHQCASDPVIEELFPSELSHTPKLALTPDEISDYGGYAEARVGHMKGRLPSMGEFGAVVAGAAFQKPEICGYCKQPGVIRYHKPNNMYDGNHGIYCCEACEQESVEHWEAMWAEYP